MSEHARFSPSGASRWLTCPGSIGMEASLPDTSSSYADEGTAAHTLASDVLQAILDGDKVKADLRSHLGRTIHVGERSYIVDDEMAEHVQTYVDTALIYAAGADIKEVEQRVYFGSHIGAPDDEAFGTVDFGAVDTAKGEITVVDFKYGMGVKVSAESNAQMQLYALGYLLKYDMLADFSKVRMVICQPRIGHIDEALIDIADLMAFADDARQVVNTINGDFDIAQPGPQSMTGPLVPSGKACMFCKAKATCPALRAEVNQAVTTTASVDDFTDLTEIPPLTAVPSDALGAAMDKVGLLEDLAKAIRAEVERRLLSDEPVASPQGGYKIVQGKRGNRAWSSDDEVTALLKSFRLRNEEIYEFKLKGPAKIEKLIAKDNPRRWTKLEALITQADGKPSVAPMSDGRPAISRADAALDFDDLTGAEDLV